MMTFDADPKLAEQQMHAIIFYLTTFGYIDGDFDLSEKQFVKDYIGKVVAHRVKVSKGDAAPDLQAELASKWTTHFHEVFDEIDHGIRSLFTEAVAKDEDVNKF